MCLALLELSPRGEGGGAFAPCLFFLNLLMVCLNIYPTFDDFGSCAGTYPGRHCEPSWFPSTREHPKQQGRRGNDPSPEQVECYFRYALPRPPVAGAMLCHPHLCYNNVTIQANIQAIIDNRWKDIQPYGTNFVSPCLCLNVAQHWFVSFWCEMYSRLTHANMLCVYTVFSLRPSHQSKIPTELVSWLREESQATICICVQARTCVCV